MSFLNQEVYLDMFPSISEDINMSTIITEKYFEHLNNFNEDFNVKNNDNYSIIDMIYENQQLFNSMCENSCYLLPSFSLSNITCILNKIRYELSTIIHILDNHGSLLKYFPDEIKSHDDLCFIAINNDEEAIKYSNNKTKPFCINALKINGLVLSHMIDLQIPNIEQYYLVALNTDIRTLSLLEDYNCLTKKDWLYVMYEHSFVFKHIPKIFMDNEHLITNIVYRLSEEYDKYYICEDTDYLYHEYDEKCVFHYSKRIQNSKQIINNLLLSTKHKRIKLYIFENISDKLKNDEPFIREILERHSIHIYPYLHTNLKSDLNIINLSMNINSDDTYKHVPHDIRQNTQIAMVALANGTELSTLPYKLLSDKKFMIDFVTCVDNEINHNENNTELLAIHFLKQLSTKKMSFVLQHDRELNTYLVDVYHRTTKKYDLNCSLNILAKYKDEYDKYERLLTNEEYEQKMINNTKQYFAPIFSIINRLNDSCIICMENIQQNERHLTKCGHVFHHDCLCDWQQHFANNRRHSRQFFECPLCKKNIKHVKKSW